jgi:hypothetical protein
MRRCHELARFNEHFTNMLIAVVRGCNGRQVMKIENIHGEVPFKKQTSKLVT